jgi:hypothetical protein
MVKFSKGKGHREPDGDDRKGGKPDGDRDDRAGMGATSPDEIMASQQRLAGLAMKAGGKGKGKGC